MDNFARRDGADRHTGWCLAGAGTLGDKNIGQNKAVGLGTLTLISGTGLASNYTLLDGSRTATITPASLTLTTSDVVKTYDGGLSVADARVAAAPIVKAGSNTQLFGLDSVSGGSYAFTSARAGSGNRTVTVAGVTVNDGNNGQNYAVTYVSNTTSTIDPKALTVTALSQTKVYDSNTSVASSALNVGYSVSGLVGSESLSGVTLAYTNANVSRNGGGTVLSDKTIAASAAVAGASTQLSDYAISYVNNTTSAITPKLVSLSAAKVYDGNTDLSGSVAVKTGIVGEVLGYSNAQANSAEVGAVGNYIRQIILVSSLTSSASNYILPILDASTAPVLISMPLPSSVTMSATYDRLEVANAPTSMPAVTGPVVVASLNTSGQGFVSVDPINTPSLDAGEAFEVTVPVEAFRNARSDAQITLSVNLPDGSALPTWVEYDSAAAVLRGTSPGGIAQLDVEVTAVDELGNKISTIINLKFSEIN